MADQIKKIQVPSETFYSGTKTRKRARSRVPPQVVRETQKGGDNSGALVQLAASKVPSTPTMAPVVSKTTAEPVGVQSTISKSTPSPILGGGGATAKPTDKTVKVVLAPKKKTQKVVLSPAKKVVKLLPATGNAPVPTAASSKKTRGKTQKVARRIRVSVEGLNKKINRAKTIKKESQTLTIEKIKSELTAAGLIKKESKAPESILRQMYTDFQLLKQRAL
jgi:hypothetical protein